MAEQVNGPDKDEPDKDRGPAAPDQSGEHASFKHTPWQNFIRDLFMMFGPAQTGLPPYATPEEREAWRLANQPEPPRAERKSTAPPGYRMVEYTDGQGYLHRSLVPITAPPAVPTPDEPPTDATGD